MQADWRIDLIVKNFNMEIPKSNVNLKPILVNAYM